MIKCIFFDLDGTLYDTNLYFSSAFKEIADYLNPILKARSQDIESKLWELLREKGSTYPRLFDDLLKAYGVINKNLVRKLVEIFHTAPIDNLKMYPDAKEFILKIKPKYKLGIITEGSKKKQFRKIKKLGLAKIMSVIVYAQDLKYSKSNPLLYKHALSLVDFRPSEGMYIGDNPYTDFVGPRKIGMFTVRLMRGEFAKVMVEKSDAQLKDFRELTKFSSTSFSFYARKLDT